MDNNIESRTINNCSFGKSDLCDRKASKKEIVLGLFIFIVLFLLSTRYWIFQKDIIVGHNWDFVFPGMDFIASRVKDQSNYLWSDYSGKTLLLQSLCLQSNLFSLSVELFGVSLTIKLLTFFALLISFLSMRRLLSSLVRCDSLSLISAALFYAFSPFLFSAIIAGSWYSWLAYAFAPLYFYSFRNIVLFRRYRQYPIFIIAMVFLLGFPQYFLVVNAILLCYFTYCIYEKNITIAQFAVRWGLSVCIVIMTNAYWLLPLWWHLADFNANVVHDEARFGAFAAVRHSLQNIMHIFFLTGFNDRNMYFFSLRIFPRIMFICSMTVSWWVVFLAMCRRQYLLATRVLWLFLAIFLLFAVLIKGGNAPFGDFSMWVYNHFTLMKIYRSPQNIFMAVAFLFPIILISSYAILSETTPGVGSKLLLILLIGFMAGWLDRGDFGHEKLMAAHRDHVDFYKIDPALVEVYRGYDQRQLISNSFFLPNVYSALFVKNRYQNEAQGGVPEYSYMKCAPVFVRNINRNAFLDSLDRKIPYDFIRNNSVRYITFRRDIKHIFWNTPPGYYDSVESVFDDHLTVVFKSDFYKTYLVDDKDFRPVLTLSPKLTITENNNFNANGILVARAGQLDKLIAAKMLGSDFESAFPEEGLVEYKRVSPVKYQLILRNIPSGSKFLLRFSRFFDRGWKLFPVPINKISRLPLDITELDYSINPVDVRDQATKEELGQYIGKYGLSGIRKKYPVKFVSRKFNNAIQNNNMINGLFYETYFRPMMPECTHFKASDESGFLNAFLVDINFINKKFPDAVVLNINGSYDIHLVAEFYSQRYFIYGLIVSVIIFLFLVAITFNQRIVDDGD